ncbi:hypothetical protein [Absidia glauca]|uniref:Uncharacterized protein n=1 Tax=Absidia glauca TaxID=4829 RepID=A0A168RA26_ABSGL|nr:hypothetical protein [Absidia glauca]
MLPPSRTSSSDSLSTQDHDLPDYSIYATSTPPPDYLTLEDPSLCCLNAPSPSKQCELRELGDCLPVNVTNQACHDLLSFLYSVDAMLKTFPQDLQRIYMCRAELRYIRWLQVLQREKPTHSVVSRIIIPPLDVMLCWYVHMLSPFRYHDDLIRNSWEHVFNYPLPLEKAREVKTKSGTGKDPLSERFWAVFVPDEPYELDLEELRQDDRVFTCVFCHESQPSTWTDYALLRTDPSLSIICGHCGSESSARTLSCYQFVRDVLESSDTRILFKGIMLDSDGQKAKSSTEKGIKVLLMAQFMKEHNKAPVVDPSMIQSSTPCDWDGILQLLKSVRKRGKDRFGDDMTWNVLLDMVQSSYFGIVTPLCIDLVQAVGRQHAFLKSVVATDWINVATLRFAIHRYRMFLVLIKQQTVLPVPTVDIDLCWHVHLVSSPRAYNAYCMATFGGVINHDDTIPEDNQQGGAVLMAMAWHKKYKEPYTTAPFVADHTVSLPSVVHWVKRKALALKKGTRKGSQGDSDDEGSSSTTTSDVCSTSSLDLLSCGSTLSLATRSTASTAASSSSSSSGVPLSSDDKYHLFLNSMTGIALHNQDAVNAWYGKTSTAAIRPVEELDRHVLYLGSYGYIGTLTNSVPMRATN